MVQLGAIALGGAIGSVLRFVIAKKVQDVITINFPFGVLLVNVIGCFLIGLLTILFIERMSVSPTVRVGILVGFLGGFTTFSTFTMDTWLMMERSAYFYAFSYIALSLLCCLFATWIGILAGRSI